MLAETADLRAVTVLAVLVKVVAEEDAVVLAVLLEPAILEHAAAALVVLGVGDVGRVELREFRRLGVRQLPDNPGLSVTHQRLAEGHGAE